MVTIRDVAKLAGVGVGTASRALSGAAPVAAATRKAVQDAALMLRYRPSSVARALSKRELGIIGVLTPHFEGIYHATALAVAERVIRQAGKHLLVVSSIDRDDKGWADAEGLAFLQDRNCDGILMLGPKLSERELVRVAERGPALALVNRTINALADCCFSVDHRAAGRSVAEYLLNRGHRTFAVITGPMQVEDARLRQEGFAEALAAAGFSLDARLVCEGDYHFPSGTAAAERLLASGLEFGALFCGNDEMAISARARLAEEEVRPVIVGYDNLEVLGYAGLGISSVAVPVEDVVANACADLLNRCYGGDRPVNRTFATRIVSR